MRAEEGGECSVTFVSRSPRSQFLMGEGGGGRCAFLIEGGDTVCKQEASCILLLSLEKCPTFSRHVQDFFPYFSFRQSFPVSFFRIYFFRLSFPFLTFFFSFFSSYSFSFSSKPDIGPHHNTQHIEWLPCLGLTSIMQKPPGNTSLVVITRNYELLQWGGGGGCGAICNFCRAMPRFFAALMISSP